MRIGNGFRVLMNEPCIQPAGVQLRKNFLAGIIHPRGAHHKRFRAPSLRVIRGIRRGSAQQFSIGQHILRHFAQSNG